MPGWALAAFAALALAALALAWPGSKPPGRAEFLLLGGGFCVLAGLCAALYGWGASLRCRLALSEEFAVGADSRFGPETVVHHMLRSLRDHYSAEVCLFLLRLPRRHARLFRISAKEGEAVEVATAEASRLLALLAALPENDALPGVADHPEEAAAIAALLGCPGLLSLALPAGFRLGGRVLIGRQRNFGRGDLADLRPVVDQAAVRLENAMLLESLAAESTERERQRIARDLHDSAIQPYIGLKFGLEALARKLRQQPEAAREVRSLVDWVNREIGEMRRLVGGLRGDGSGAQISLLASLRRQTERYSELFGIAVEVVTEGELQVGGPLAREILHMVSEGLSNICRHSRARRASVQLRQAAGSLELRIANDRDGEAGGTPSFVPRSLNERAAALSGSLAVQAGDHGWAVVSISIPMAG